MSEAELAVDTAYGMRSNFRAVQRSHESDVGRHMRVAATCAVGNKFQASKLSLASRSHFLTFLCG